MTTRHVFWAVSLIVAAFGTVLLVETGRLALGDYEGKLRHGHACQP